MDALALLPHRPPMRLLDEVAELVPGQRARGVREIRDGRLLLRRAFPGRADRAGGHPGRDDRAGRRPCCRRAGGSDDCARDAAFAGGGAWSVPLPGSRAARRPPDDRGPRAGSLRRPVQGRRGRPRGRRAGRRRQRHARNRGSARHEAMAGMPERRRSTAGQMRRLVRDLRTEASGTGREAVAVGVGVFIGALPVYGLHLILCLAAGSLLRLNRLKLYVAANISNPLMAPLLILSEIQAGALARRGELQSLTLSAVRAIDPWTFGGDLIARQRDCRRPARADARRRDLPADAPSGRTIRSSPISCAAPPNDSSRRASWPGSSRAGSSPAIRSIARWSWRACCRPAAPEPWSTWGAGQG